jgi:hypothetical protein
MKVCDNQLIKWILMRYHQSSQKGVYFLLNSKMSEIGKQTATKMTSEAKDIEIMLF